MRAGRRAALALALIAGGAILLYRASRGGAGARRRRPMASRGPMTQALVRVNPADCDLGEPGRNLERRLDEAVQETFPGSDAIAVHIE